MSSRPRSWRRESPLASRSPVPRSPMSMRPSSPARGIGALFGVRGNIGVQRWTRADCRCAGGYRGGLPRPARGLRRCSPDLASAIGQWRLRPLGHRSDTGDLRILRDRKAGHDRNAWGGESADDQRQQACLQHAQLRRRSRWSKCSPMPRSADAKVLNFAAERGE